MKIDEKTVKYSAPLPVPLLVLFCLFLPFSAQALSAIECHCFQDRSYDIARPGAADDYFLTATQNTFFALAFNVSKKDIVSKKQHGADSGDLWIAYWLADKSGITADNILATRSQHPDWSATITALNIDTGNFGSAFKLALQEHSLALDQVVVNEVLTKRHILSEQDLHSLRHNKASNKEVLACALLAAKSNQQPLLFLQQVQGHIKNWDGLMTQSGIDIQQIEQVWMNTLNALKKG
jgi:hypothetical protein